MKVQFLFASVAVCAASALLLAGSASAQWSSGTKVSNVIEGSGFPAGVSAARCGNGVVVGFGDTEANTPGSDVGFAVSKDGGSSFADRGVLADPSLRIRRLGARSIVRKSRCRSRPTAGAVGSRRW